MLGAKISSLRELSSLARKGHGREIPRQRRKRLLDLIERYNLRQILAWRQKVYLRQCRQKRLKDPLADRLPESSRLFVISFHKTGTRSVHKFLSELGLEGVHWPSFRNTGIDYEAILRPFVGDRARCVCILDCLCAESAVLSDVPFPGVFRELAESYPERKFLLMRRDAEEWWESVSRHWRLDLRPHSLDSFEAIQYGLPLGVAISSSSKALLTDIYLRHEQDVKSYFDGSGRLLELELGCGDAGSRISAFLGLSSDSHFPSISSGSVYE
ncbi:MAG: sulfotransferase [Chromatiales bacterium]